MMLLPRTHVWRSEAFDAAVRYGTADAEGTAIMFDAHARNAPLPGTLSHIGQVVDGRYELLTLLSEGGMGRVFKARHRQLDRLFALKLVHQNIMEGEEAGDRFMREARLASSLNHANVVAVTDFGKD